LGGGVWGGDDDPEGRWRPKKPGNRAASAREFPRWPMTARRGRRAHRRRAPSAREVLRALELRAPGQGHRRGAGEEASLFSLGAEGGGVGVRADPPRTSRKGLQNRYAARVLTGLRVRGGRGEAQGRSRAGRDVLWRGHGSLSDMKRRSSSHRDDGLRGFRELSGVRGSVEEGPGTSERGRRSLQCRHSGRGR